MFRRKKSEIVPVKYKVHLGRNKLENIKYSELVRSLISKEHVSFFERLLLEMNRFPLEWAEYSDGRIFVLDGSSYKRIKHPIPKEDVDQRIFLINPRYLEALPDFSAASDRQGIVGLDDLMRYPLIDMNNPNEVAYEMDLRPDHISLRHPKKVNEQYVSVFSKYAMNYNTPTKNYGRKASA